VSRIARISLAVPFPRPILRMTETPVTLLRAHSRHAPWNARGLAAHATALVDAAGFRPTNTSARAAPSARAIRFYVAQRLLDRPEGAGTTATYGYRHLLQLLAIKIRQREGQTLDVIKREMAGVSGEQLERRVATALAPALAHHTDQAVRNDDVQPIAQWRRVQVADGVELHVRADTFGARDDVIVAMRDGIRAAIGRAESRT
jgi:DNA-binding transcriptional MerR regulator